MREIKFRQPIFNKDGIFISWHYFNVGEVLAGYVYQNNHPTECYEFTGLKDKTGVDIYEEDILRDKWGTISKVIFKNGSFVSLRLLESKPELTALIWNTDEIVGNIHQNPELIRNQQ